MARVNLIKQTQTLTRTVSDFLTQKGRLLTEVVPVLLFADPGVHIDSTVQRSAWCWQTASTG